MKLPPIKTRSMSHTPPKLLSFEEFIAQYGDNTRYELIDGELRDMEPTGPHEAVAGSIAGRIYVEIFRANFNWLIPKNCLIKPLYAEATALRPDVVVLDQAELSQEPLWQKEPVRLKPGGLSGQLDHCCACNPDLKQFSVQFQCHLL
ncbi:Uma2 family endonuclease [Nodularia sp. LEGE 04288]|nr:Uma2 family endonuclease [Nodularia sp. LEGE 04288]